MKYYIRLKNLKLKGPIDETFMFKVNQGVKVTVLTVFPFQLFLGSIDNKMYVALMF